MAVQERANSFAQAIANRVKELSAVELFEGKLDGAVNKLVIDHVVPVVWQADVEYDIHITCRVNHRNPNTGQYVQQIMRSTNSFTASQVLMGASEWPSIIEVITYPMVSALKRRLKKLDDPLLILLQGNDSCPHNMRRIHIK